MNIKFRTKNFNLTEGAKASITNKFENISDYFNADIVFDVYIVRRDKDYKTEIKVQRGKDFIRSEETGKSIEHSVDNAVSTLKKRVRKVKSMRITKKRSGEALKNMNKEELCVENEEFEPIDFKVERRKCLELESMGEEDAILNLESLNHDFYIFKNSDLNDKVCVVYRREVGYGVIETI